MFGNLIWIISLLARFSDVFHIAGCNTLFVFDLTLPHVGLYYLTISSSHHPVSLPSGCFLSLLYQSATCMDPPVVLKLCHVWFCRIFSSSTMQSCPLLWSWITMCSPNNIHSMDLSITISCYRSLFFPLHGSHILVL